MKKIATVMMKMDRETKNTFRFSEEGFPEGDYVIGSLYVQKTALQPVDRAVTEIRVTVEG